MIKLSPTATSLFHLQNAIDHVVKTFEPTHSISIELVWFGNENLVHVIASSTLPFHQTSRFLHVAGKHENAEFSSVNESNRWRVDLNCN